MTGALCAIWRHVRTIDVGRGDAQTRLGERLGDLKGRRIKGKKKKLRVAR